MSSVLLRSLASSASGHHAVASAAAAAASRQSAAAVILTTKSGRLLTVSPSNRFFESCRKMSSFLVDEPKYAFLKDLGIEKRNPGVYNGTWGGSGDVSWSHFYPWNFVYQSVRLPAFSALFDFENSLELDVECHDFLSNLGAEHCRLWASLHLDARILNVWQKKSKHPLLSETPMNYNKLIFRLTYYLLRDWWLWAFIYSTFAWLCQSYHKTLNYRPIFTVHIGIYAST